MLNEKKFIYDDRTPDKIDYSTFQFLGSWSNHYKSWINTNLFRRMIIKYENLIKNPYETFRDLSVFINTLAKLNDPINSQKLNNAIESTKFDNLREIEKSNLFTENVFSKDKKKIPFFNLGPKNKWEQKIPLKSQKDVNLYFENDLKKLDYF